MNGSWFWLQTLEIPNHASKRKACPPVLCSFQHRRREHPRSDTSKDWADRPPIPGQPPGRDGETIQAFRIAFPDIQFTLEDVIVAADKVIVRSTARGTHRGEFLGVVPTQRTVSFMTIDIHQLPTTKLLKRGIWRTFTVCYNNSNASKLS